MIDIQSFALERYFDRHEFSAKYLLSCSDCEPMALTDLLEMADADSRRLWSNLTLAYTHTTGHPALRAAIAEMYPGLEAEDILVMAPEEGIFLFMQSLLQPGDHVICTFPGYQSLHELGRATGCEMSMWTAEESRGWHFNLNELERLIRNDTKLVVVNFPHNPTGYLPGRDEFLQLVEIVRRSGAYLFSDEMYRLLEFDETATLPAACEIYTKAISLSGLSKSYGLPGLRLGWLASRDRDLLQRIGRLKDYTTICNSAPGEILALMALRVRGKIVAAQRRRIRRNMSALDAFMQTHAGHFHWHRPKAGSVCFPRMLTTDNTHRFCETLVNAAGIMLVPSSMFAYGDHHVRFGFGREDFPAVLGRLADYFHDTKEER
jgi:aspartate/methionine/tyrosine aminotransferase